ncbi:MAG: cupredoxin domain-containing protein [Chloroflexota bacterium]|nr:cupredoxin domain-containing protein [Chloroflexota bacterium]
MRAMRHLAATLGLAVLLVACGDDDTEVADSQVVAPIGSPIAVDELDEGTEGATITIRDGGIVEEDLRLQKDQPTVLHIVNEDDSAYRFRINGLVTMVEIAAATTTDLEFTTPTVVSVDGELLPNDGASEDPIDTIQVDVQEVGGIAP